MTGYLQHGAQCHRIDQGTDKSRDSCKRNAACAGNPADQKAWNHQNKLNDDLAYGSGTESERPASNHEAYGPIGNAGLQQERETGQCDSTQERDHMKFALSQGLRSNG